MICRNRSTPPALAATFAAVLLVWAAADVHAASHAIHKCVGADGKTVFSDAPCAGEAAPADSQQGKTPDSAKPPKGGAAAADAATNEAQTPAKGAPSCAPWEPPAGEVVVDPPRRIDPDDLPHDTAGRPVEIHGSRQQHGPMSVAAACSAMVSACSQKSPDPGASIDVCFKSAPRCATGRPWEEEKPCCPAACWQKYADLRSHCVDASTASYKALFEIRCVASDGEAKVEPSATPPPTP